MRIFSYLLLLVLFMVGIVFALLNHEKVAFDYYFASKQMSLSLLLVFSLGLGIFLGFLGTVVYWLKLRVENYRLKVRLKNAEKEIANLRSVPLK